MPHSRDSLVILPGGRSRVLEPPADLEAVEAAIFRRVVASAPHDHFSAEDCDLLCAYSRALALEKRASDELQAATTGNHQAWLPVYREATRAIASYAVRLRLGPKSRHPNNTRRMSKPLSPPSYYDTMPAPPPQRGSSW